MKTPYPFQNQILKRTKNKKVMIMEPVNRSRALEYYCSATVDTAKTFGPRQCRYKALKDGLCNRHYKRKEKEK